MAPLARPKVNRDLSYVETGSSIPDEALGRRVLWLDHMLKQLPVRCESFGTERPKPAKSIG